MNHENYHENIDLTLPINAAYVSAARLTSSSIAYRMGFEIDCVEDIKSAVSEACSLIIKKCLCSKQPAVDNSFKITFNLKNDMIEISIELAKCIDFVNSDDEMSLLVLKALVDHMNVDIKDDKLYSIVLKKYKKENILEKLEG